MMIIMMAITMMVLVMMVLMSFYFCFSLFILPAYEVRRITDKTAVFEVISGTPGRVLLGVGLCFEVAD